MRTFGHFIQKEWKHILRDRRTLSMLFLMPVMQILIFGFALTNEVKHINTAVLDLSKDKASHQLIARIEANKYFTVSKLLETPDQIDSVLKGRHIRSVLVIPPDFIRHLKQRKTIGLQLIHDASDPNLAGASSHYMERLIGSFQREKLSTGMPPLIKAEVRMLYNPQQIGAYSFVPGVMNMILMLLCTMMTAVSIVREKELGTMEILLVSPAHPIKIILAKAVPYLILSVVNVSMISVIGVFLLEVPLRGSLLLLLSESLLFIAACLSLGLFISNITVSQQTALLIALIGMFLPTVIFSGFMFPIENMPRSLQWIALLVPSKWYYDLLKGIMIKGEGIRELWQPTFILLIMTVSFLLLSIRNFKTHLS